MTRIGITIDGPARARGPGASLLRALAPIGEVELLTAGTGLAAQVAGLRPSIVFNAARHPVPPVERHHVAAVLEAQGIPFSGSGSETLALTASRRRMKEALGARQIPTAVYTVVEDPSQLVPLGRRAFPLAVFRPTDVLTARQCVVVESARELDREVRAIWAQDPAPLLVERHLAGIIFACLVLGNGTDRVVLPPVSLMSLTAPTAGDKPRLDYVPDGLKEGLERVVLEATRALGLHDCARVDVALSDTGVPHVVTVDPLPDVSGSFGNPVLLAADAAGMDEVELVQRWLLLAADRSGVELPRAPIFDEVRRRTPPRGLRMRTRHA